jgi:WD40 repeat protein
MDSVKTDSELASLTSAIIMSITLHIECGITITSDSDGVVRTWDISTGLCKSSFQTPVKGLSWGDVRMVNGKFIFVWHVEGEGKIYLWDVGGDKPLQTVEAHSEVRGLRISGDGSKVFCLDRKSIQAWSVLEGGVMGKVELEDEAYLDPLCVDGSKIWVCSKRGSLQGWEFGISGSLPIPLSNTSSERPRLHFVGGALLGGSTRIRDTVTGKEVFQLPERYANPSATQWDGRHLVAGYDSGEVVILDCNSLYVQ